ncbi:MAG: DegV family protein [Syntrophomonadaceae bacterium]|nr:DegV family protein [Syntrophomonadaceae bacterium]
MSRVRIFADAACDLDAPVLQQYGITCLHMPVTIGEHTYRDRLDLSPTEFYEILAKSDVMPVTAQITPMEFIEAFMPVIEQSDDEIIYIGFSSGLSNTFQSSELAAAELAPDRITVIDSLSASVGYALIVLKAAQMADDGATRAEIVDVVNDYVRRIQHLFIVGNFDMLKRGGRVGSTTAAVGNLLNIKLILHFVDGKIVPLEKVRGLKKAKKRMLEIMGERAADDLKDQLIGVNHAYDLAGAEEIQRLVRERFGCEKFIISEIGLAIGSHVGAGTYSVFFLGK